MTSPPPSFLRELPWDSKAFGFRVARIENIQSPKDQFPIVAEQLKANAITLAYWEAPKDDEPSRTAAQKIGGDLINSRVILERGLLAADRVPPVLKTISNPQPAQRTDLNNLAISSGGSSRFAQDPKFPRPFFKQLYQTWMTKSLSGQLADAVIVAEEEQRIVGMITVSVHEKLGQIGLFGVAPEKRGRGLGKRLLADAISWFARQKCDLVKVPTQGENVGALGIYGSFGFRPAKQTNVFHFWRTKR